jgi:hypothetical protein
VLTLCEASENAIDVPDHNNAVASAAISPMYAMFIIIYL